MKLSDIVVSWEALQKLGAMDDLPAKAAYRVAKAIRHARREMEAFEKARLDTIKKYGVSKDNGSTYEVAPDKLADFRAELEALVSEDVEWSIPKLSPADLGEYVPEPGVLSWLDYLIDIDSEI